MCMTCLSLRLGVSNQVLLAGQDILKTIFSFKASKDFFIYLLSYTFSPKLQNQLSVEIFILTSVKVDVYSSTIFLLLFGDKDSNINKFLLTHRN